AVEYFQRDVVGLPAELVAQFRSAPFRPALEAIAHTLVYDTTITADRSLVDVLGSISTPTLVVDGETTWPQLRAAAEALTLALPTARRRSVPTQNHELDPNEVGAVVAEFVGR